MRAYVKDPAEIYRLSFEAIRREARLDRLPDDIVPLALRLIHACGMPDLLEDLVFSPDVAAAGRGAIEKGAPILCDTAMTAAGIIRRALPAGCEVLAGTEHPEVAAKATEIGNTRSAAAVDLWGESLDGAVVAIGNAPTALFRLLEVIAAGAPRPAAIIGMPVGFVGAAESKEALLASGLTAIIVRGRRGGSAMAAAAVNALASEKE